MCMILSDLDQKINHQPYIWSHIFYLFLNIQFVGNARKWLMGYKLQEKGKLKSVAGLLWAVCFCIFPISAFEFMLA